MQPKLASPPTLARIARHFANSIFSPQLDFFIKIFIRDVTKGRK